MEISLTFLVFFLARPLCELPAFYWENHRSIESVFEAVNATKLNEDNLKGAKIFHEVQKLLIVNDIPNVLNVVDEWSKSITTSEHEILRFFAHMVIMLKVKMVVKFQDIFRCPA